MRCRNMWWNPTLFLGATIEWNASSALFSRRDSLSVANDPCSVTLRSERETMLQVIKWGLVDGVFLVSFAPLLYLVKQWSY